MDINEQHHSLLHVQNMFCILKIQCETVLHKLSESFLVPNIPKHNCFVSASRACVKKASLKIGYLRGNLHINHRNCKEKKAFKNGYLGGFLPGYPSVNNAFIYTIPYDFSYYTCYSSSIFKNSYSCMNRHNMYSIYILHKY